MVSVGTERIRLNKGSIDKLKRRGAKGSPWGTPCKTEIGEERELLILILVVQLW